MKDRIVFHVRNMERNVPEGVTPVIFPGAVTLVFEKHGDDFHCGTAICSKKDQFSRKRGRTIAIGRLERGNPHIGSIHFIIGRVMEEVSTVFPKGIARNLNIALSRVPESHLLKEKS